MTNLYFLIILWFYIFITKSLSHCQLGMSQLSYPVGLFVTSPFPVYFLGTKASHPVCFSILCRHFLLQRSFPFQNHMRKVPCSFLFPSFRHIPCNSLPRSFISLFLQQDSTLPAYLPCFSSCPSLLIITLWHGAPCNIFPIKSRPGNTNHKSVTQAFIQAGHATNDILV